MSKNQVLRPEKSHTVQMPEGSKTASRARTRKLTEPPIEERAEPERRVKAPPVTRPAAPAPAVAAALPPAARSKAVLANRSKTTPRKPIAPPAPAPAPPVLPPPPPPESALWEARSPVMARLEQLRARNAQIAEQIQRLTLTLPPRGKTP